MSSCAQRPPLDGSLHLPQFIDFHLEHNPSSSAYVFAQAASSGRNASTEIVHITFEQWARAVHRAAIALRPIPRKPEEDGRVLAMIVTTDTLLYQAVVLGTIRAGFVPFMISPRNSPAAIDDMLSKMSCSHVLHISSHSAERETIECLKTPDLVLHEMPTLEELFGPDLHSSSSNFKPYPDLQYPIDGSKTAFIIHSSGSTGFPKPVPQSFTTALNWMSFLSVSGAEGPDINTCAALAIPSFHAFGVNFQLLYALTLVKPAGLFPPTSLNFLTGHVSNDSPPMFAQPANVLKHVQLTKSDMLLSVPSLLMAWRGDPAHVEILKTLKIICCSSGPLPRGIGAELVRKGVPLCTSYGATEFGIPTYRLPLGRNGKPSIEAFKDIRQRLEDWNYVAFNDFVKLRLLPAGKDSFELQILTCDTHQPAIENLPDAKGYATCDVIQAHPRRKGLWRVIGRTDEVIVLSAGEKVVPNLFEDLVSSSAILSGVIMFGRGRQHCGVLLEPRDPGAWAGKTAQLVDAVWPLIEQGNAQAPAFGRILRDMIVVTSVEKPMERVGKGSLARKATLAAYETEIEEAYRLFESNSNVERPLSWCKEDVVAWLQTQTKGLSHKGKRAIDGEGNLFDFGFDSISAMSLRSRIAGALPGDISDQVSHTIVYDNPTLNTLAAAIINLLSGDDGQPNMATKQKAVENMIRKYSVFDPIHKPKETLSSHGILLTGSTGALGSHVLEILLGRSDITKVFVVNRPSATPSSERQAQSFASKGLDPSLLNDDRIVWLEGDPAGLAELWVDEVDVIIHNAWMLDFNHGLSSFESHIRTTHALINVVRNAAHKIRFLFTSSTSAVQSWDSSHGAVPERVHAPAEALGKGYGESKYVVEALLAKAEFEYTVLRIGQIAGGAPLGAWATTDWVPTMVKSSIAIGALPSAVGTLSWIPMPTVSQAVVDGAMLHDCEPVVNLVHPHAIEWDRIMHATSDSLFDSGLTSDALPMIKFSDWLDRLKSLDVGQQDRAPALKMLPFFEHFARKDEESRASGVDSSESFEAGGRATFMTDRAQLASPSLANLRGVELGREDVDRWIAFWKGSEFL